MSEDFDFDKGLKALQSGKAITGKDGIMTPLIKQLTEAALEAEILSTYGLGMSYRDIGTQVEDFYGITAR